MKSSVQAGQQIVSSPLAVNGAELVSVGSSARLSFARLSFVSLLWSKYCAHSTVRSGLGPWVSEVRKLP